MFLGSPNTSPTLQAAPSWCPQLQQPTPSPPTPLTYIQRDRQRTTLGAQCALSQGAYICMYKNAILYTHLPYICDHGSPSVVLG